MQSNECEVALYVHDDGSVSGHQLGAWSSISYRREEPGDAEALQRARDVNRLQRLAHEAMFHSWPIEDVRRVLAAWPGEQK